MSEETPTTVAVTETPVAETPAAVSTPSPKPAVAAATQRQTLTQLATTPPGDKKNRKEELRAARKEVEEATRKAADLETKVGVLKTYAAVEMSLLDTKQQELVKQLAGDDPSEQLKQIAAIKAMKAAAPVETPPPPPTAKPAHTAPVAAPAPAAVATAELTVKERYSQVKSIPDQNAREVARTLFLLEHGQELLKNL